jgi:hypothetical protein
MNWAYGKLVCASLLLSFAAVSYADSLCRDGLCEVMSVESESRTNSFLNGRAEGNVVIFDPEREEKVVHVFCRVSAEVPVAAWFGLRTMMESVNQNSAASGPLSNAQQVMFLFYSSVQEMLKEFSCDRAAALWK